ncbi:helix-turn-helix domain-containing protein [Virgibacillus proomii]|uniref:helix-turn-helix domain-containing protein n=1 Tax=Virgibacillus proomii TaxID=84407 RepID=UPI001C104215|nr:helix-turn-helix domain-containing protein [Virgibacillus proomii]
MDELYEELRRNFIIYFDCNMNITYTDKQLFIHRNTLIYRLHKIEKLARLNTRNF